MNEPLSFVTAFLLGFFGSVHCMGMCGGIVGALSLNQKHHGYKQGIIQISYHIGRICTYGLLGLAAGFLGLWLASSHDTIGTVMRSLAGIILVLMGIYIMGLNQSLLWLEKLGSHLWKRIQPLSKHLLPIQYPKQALALGLIWGLLPCGLVYSTLSWALVAADPAHSALLMMVFGLGNLPALLSFAAFTQQLNHFKQQAWLKTMMGLLIISFGFWTLLAPIFI